jgi:dihydrofolate reductase
MRKVTFGGANSLDNYIARKDDSVEWLMWCKEAAQIMKQYWKTIDTILMGRKTYEVGIKLSTGKSDPFGGMQTYVFSRTLKKLEDKRVELVKEDAAAFVRKLKSMEGKDIMLMGGGDFAKTLFEADLIDEVGFNIHPVILGAGIPLFHEMNRQINLELIECQAFKNGCVYVSYRVKKSKPPRKNRRK